MSKFNFKNQRTIFISVVLIAAIVFGAFLITHYIQASNKADDNVSTNVDPTTNVEIDKNKLGDKSEVEVKEIEPTENKTNVKNATLPNRTNTIVPVVTKESQKTVTAEPPKERPKTKDDLTNKNKMPTYEEKEVKPQTQTPKGGETNDKGQKYFPGFGWVDDGGENKSEAVNSSGDINKPVGKMD